MDTLMAIRSGIFLVAGLMSILFRKQFNNFKNHMLEKFHMKNRIKDERKVYFYMGIVYILISIILVVFSITH
ncbi:hypothetical protein GQ473_01300 [archaeon]|nr:hypothetical protein [archaeon]